MHHCHEKVIAQRIGAAFDREDVFVVLHLASMPILVTHEVSRMHKALMQMRLQLLI